MMTRRVAELEALTLLEKYDIITLPIPVDQLAALEGAKIVRQRFSGNQSGFMYRNGNDRIIGINSTHGRRRQRFTVAHEIGHMLIHQSNSLVVDREVNFRDGRSSLGVDVKEIEANAFAASLLMPEDKVLAEMRKMGNAHNISSRDDLISHLVHIFDVSGEAMGYRLINLGIYS